MAIAKDQYKFLGQELVYMFDLPRLENGRYNTTWGDKTYEGLGRCVARLVQDADAGILADLTLTSEA